MDAVAEQPAPLRFHAPAAQDGLRPHQVNSEGSLRFGLLWISEIRPSER